LTSSPTFDLSGELGSELEVRCSRKTDTVHLIGMGV